MQTKVIWSEPDKAIYTYTQTTGPIKVIRWMSFAFNISEAVEMFGTVTFTKKSFSHIQEWEEV
jgi:hypothetical protein